MPMRIHDGHAAVLQELKRFADRLNTMIEDGTFYRLPFSKRYRLIRRVKRLYSKLRGPISEVKLKHILAATAVLSLVVPVKVGTGPESAYVSLLTACSLDPGGVSYGSSIARFAIPKAAATMERYDLTVSGTGMVTTQVSYPGSIKSIVLEVPAGAGRYFEMVAVVDPADPGSIRRYRGVSTVDLEPGSTVDIALSMEVLPLVPSFKAAVLNPFGITGIKYYAHPAIADLDGDGDLDLLVGDSYNPPSGGLFQYFENTGTAGAPSFAAPDPDPFNLDYSYLGKSPRPAIADLDGDGDLDILASSYGDGAYLDHFKNDGTATVPNFAGPNYLVSLDNHAYPTIGDLDGDGDLDILVGDYIDSPDYMHAFQYFKNTGPAGSPSFAAPLPNPFDLTNVADYAAPALVDIDGDGDLDILAGDQSGNFQYFENTGTATSPAFAAPVQNPFGLNGITANKAVPTFGDLDGDGDLDLIVGGYGTDLWYFENTAL